jgi:XTP/dITP diphosphohydrolase
MDKVMSIVVATSNRSRLAEIEALLGDLPVEVLSTKDALGDHEPPLVATDGETFEANALRKAQVIASATMMVTLADGAGLETDALGGRPGVRSSRFAGEGATDAENNAELLRRMEEVEDVSRSARFRAAIAIVDPWNPGHPVVVEGRIEGQIARTPSGTGGFGYDPLFIVDGKDCTLAELSDDERNEVGHRAKVLAAAGPKLIAIVNARLEEADAVVQGSYVPPPSQRGGMG